MHDSVLRCRGGVLGVRGMGVVPWVWGGQGVVGGRGGLGVGVLGMMRTVKSRRWVGLVLVRLMAGVVWGR